MKRLLITVALTVVLFGCVAHAPLNTPEDVAAGVKTRQSDFDKGTLLVGPEQGFSIPRGLGGDQVTWRVDSYLRGADTPPAKSLLVKIWHQDRTWRYFSSASFEGGETVDTRRIDSDPSCMAGGGIVSCSFTEIVSVRIPSAKWDAATTSGLRVRINGRTGGHVIIQIPAIYVAGINMASSAAR